jgi:3-keto-disaccharide hydrolase
VTAVRTAVVIGAAACQLVLAAGAQEKTAPYAPKQSDRPEAVSGDEPGFRPIFDGRTLTGWDGNSRYWRVEDGALVGEITPETVIKSNTFIIWRGGRPKDFELKLEYRITASGNSGINYRSSVVPDTVTADNAYAMRGYQFDVDGAKRYVGNNYEEKGRLFLAVRGQLTRVVGGRPPVLVSAIGDAAELGSLATDGWNTAHIMARGSTLTHILNGRVMCVVIDDDAPNRPADGLIGVQVHVGPAMKVEYRNIRLKDW